MATRSAKIDQKADLIWAIADKLTGVYKPHEYGDVILPLTVIRRFDCILSDTKDAVLQKYDEVKNLPMKDILLRKASKKDFYNTSKYTFERLMDDPDHIEENFREYLNKFSANVRDILEKFKFDGHITTMANKGILYIVLKEYTTDRGNLHPNEISNLEMGYIFEEIIRRFSESHNEDAGQHYTPREVIQLMVNILFYDDNDILSGNNVAKTIYDPACGTGGMLSVAEEYLHSLNASTELVSFGQEINDQTFAICKADMLIKGRAKYFLIVPYMLREAVDGRYGKDANRVLRAIDSAEKDCGIRLLEADPKAEGVIGSRVLPKGWVARKPSDIYWNGIRTFGIFCDYGLSIPEYVSLAVKLKEQKSVSRLGNRNDDAEENDKDDSDAGDIGNIRFWNLPIYHDDWRDNLTIELTQEEAFYLDKQIQKSTKGSLLEYVLKNHIDLNEYDDFASLTAELSEKVSEKLAYMMKLACDFNNLVYMARVRYNVMLSEDENTYANDEWSRLLPDIRHNATVDLDAVFGELQLINPRAKSFLSGIQTAFMASDIDMADELIRKRERSLKGAARAKLSRTKEFDHSKWVGGGMLDYRFSNARRIVNDIYAGEVNADV